MRKLQRIKIFAFAKFQGFLMALIGLLVGILYAFGGFTIDVLVSLGWLSFKETPGLSYGTLLAFGALIGMPIISGASGFIIGIFEALLYNLFAKYFWGLKMDFEPKKSSIKK